MAIVGPFLPANIQFLHKESALCQLQSHFGGELSIVAPTIGHNFFVFRQPGKDFVYFGCRSTPGTGDVAVSKRLAPTRIEKNEIECAASIHGMKHVISLLLGAELVGKVVAICTNISGIKCHVFTSFM